MKEDVSWFEIAVDDAFADNAAHPLQEFEQDPQRAFFAERAADSDGALEGASVADLGDDVAVFVLLDDLESLEDVGTVHAKNGGLLHVEQVLGDFVVDSLEVDDFDGHMGLVRNGLAWIVRNVPA